MCVCVCVCEREREREREPTNECVCVCALGALNVCLSVRQTECLSVHVYEYMCDHALRLCMCVCV